MGVWFGEQDVESCDYWLRAKKYAAEPITHFGFGCGTSGRRTKKMEVHSFGPVANKGAALPLVAPSLNCYGRDA